MKRNEEGSVHLIVYALLLRNITNFHYRKCQIISSKKKKKVLGIKQYIYFIVCLPSQKCPSNAYDCT